MNNWLKVKQWMRSHGEEILLGTLTLSFGMALYTYKHAMDQDEMIRGGILDALHRGPIFAIVTDGEKLFTVEVTDAMHTISQQMKG